MKKYITFILIAIAALTLPACRTKKDVAAETVQQVESKETRWKNVSVPVRFEILEPQKMSLSGKMTMVCDKYVLVSLRMLGFEVAQIFVSPEDADVVIKQVNKIWIHEPLGARFTKLNLPFYTLQEAMLGRPEAIAKLPEGLDLALGGTEENPVLTLKIKNGSKTIMGRITLTLSEAQWDISRPAAFTAPGAEYKKVGVKDLGNILK